MAPKFSKLDRLNIRKLQIGEKIAEHGIIAERMASGDVRWSINVMVDGRRIHRIVGRESEKTTRTQAEQLIERLRTEAREDRLQLPKGRKLPLTLARAAADYMEKLKESGGKNMVPKKRHFEKRLGPALGHKRLDQISGFDLEKYRHQRKEAGASPSTINLELASLSHLFTKAVEWKWIREVPCKVKMTKAASYVAAVLTDEESDALIKAAMADADPDAWLFIAIGLHTGMRHREILQMRFEHVDADSRRLHVPRAKAGGRQQPLTQEIVDILVKEREMRTKDGTGWIFPTPRPGASKTGYRDRISKSFRRIAKAAELDPERVTPHTLRHTAVTKLVKSGVDLVTVQAISGHKSLQMVLHYAKVHAPHIDRAVTNLARPIPEPLQPKAADTATHDLHKPRLRVIKGGRQKVAKG